MLVGSVCSAGEPAAQGNSSLSESRVEDAERGVTDAALLAQNEELRRQLSLVQESVRTLTTSLAESNAEAEVFRRKFSAMRLHWAAVSGKFHQWSGQPWAAY